jgi:hypothetical protein
MSESERRALGVALETNRRASGAAMESSRRALGPAMEAQRRGSGTQIADDIRRLGGVQRKSTSLRPVEPRGGIGGQSGVGVWTGPRASTGGGIASPLTENSYSKRQFWPGGSMSSDGLFNFPAIKTMELTDSAGATVIINLAQPVTPEATP